MKAETSRLRNHFARLQTHLMKVISKGTRLTSMPSYVVLLLCLLLTGIATHRAMSAAERESRIRFEAVTNRLVRAVNSRMETYVNGMKHTRSVFAIWPNLSRHDYHEYLKETDLHSLYPGVSSFGFVKRLSSANLVFHEAAVRAEGFPDYKVWPRGPRKEYFALVYLEPFNEKTAKAFGFDPATDPARRVAMERARDTGLASTSAMTVLRQDTDPRPQPAFTIYIPIYRDGLPLATVKQRRAALIGFVAAGFRTHHLFSAIARDFSHEQGFDFAVHEGEAAPGAEARSFYDLAAAERVQTRAIYRESIPIEVHGARWVIETRARPEFFSHSSMRFPWSVLGGGLLASLLFFLLVFGSQRYSARLLHEANSANRAKDEFLATLSHELRTPLSVILGHSELLKAGCDDPLDTAESIDAIHRNARVQSQIVNDLLDVSSIIMGKINMDRSAISVRQPVMAALETVRFGAMVKAVSLGLSLGDEDFFVYADPVRLQQVFWNLLSNSLKFTPRGGHVSIDVRRAGDACEVTITDTGLGIEPDFLPFVFDSFRQEDSGSTRRYGGLGLGLSIVAKLVRLHGGRVKAESDGRDRGARFTVSLPLVASSLVSRSRLAGVSDESRPSDMSAPAY